MFCFNAAFESIAMEENSILIEFVQKIKQFFFFQSFFIFPVMSKLCVDKRIVCYNIYVIVTLFMAFVCYLCSIVKDLGC